MPQKVLTTSRLLLLSRPRWSPSLLIIPVKIKSHRFIASSSSSSSSSAPPPPAPPAPPLLPPQRRTFFPAGITETRLRSTLDGSESSFWRLSRQIKAMESRAYPTATQPTSPLLHAPTPRRQAAILIPLCHLEIEDGEPLNTLRTPALLFTVRSLQLRSHAGEVSFPGGAHDPEHDGEFPDRNDMAAHTAKFPEVNDDNIQTISYWDAVAATLGRTAVRETREEVPSIGDVRILGRLPHVLDKSQTIEVHPFVGYIGTIKTTVEVVKPRSEHTSSSSVIQPTPRPTHPTHMSTRFRLHNIQWSPDEVSDVFAVPLSDLFDPTRIHTQLFRGHSDLPVPSWHGPPVSDSIAKSMHELPREHPHHAGAWKKEPAAVRPPVEPSLSLSNIVVDPQTQVAHYRIWGLTAYVLGRFLRKCIVPMVVHAGKPYPAEALVAGPKAGNVMGKDTTDGKSASDEYDTKRK